MMNIIVCVKQVPDTTNVKIDPVTNTLVREGVQSIVNPFDMYAVEEALRLKERLGNAKTIVISMGPPQVEAALREIISLGIDEAVLLSDRAFAGSDTWATSYVLAQAVKKIGDYGIILCGKQAIDGDTAQVGPGIAAHLNIPQVTFVKKIEEVSVTGARVERMMEEGHDVIEVQLPCVLTVVKEINIPRLPSFKGKMRAKSISIPVWGKKDLDLEPENIGLEGSPTQVVKIFSPPHQKRDGKIFTQEQLPEAFEALTKMLLAHTGKAAKPEDAVAKV